MKEKLTKILEDAPWCQYQDMPKMLQSILGNQLTDYGMTTLVEYLIEHNVIISNTIPKLTDVEIETLDSFNSMIEKYKSQGNTSLIIRIMKYLFDMSEEDIIKELKGDND